MDNQPIFNFNTDISKVDLPTTLNNPFGATVPKIARIAAAEFQEFIVLEAQKWKQNGSTPKGKMFGVLVVQKKELTYHYLGANSGRLPGNVVCSKFVPHIFDSANDFYFDQGMNEVSEICNQINDSNNPSEIGLLKEKRKQKSNALQQLLFENSNFLNRSGNKKNILEIFKHSPNGIPPSAAGECAGPKLLQYAFKHGLKPIASAEFWWGNPSKNETREHRVFYPACQRKCRPILEYMLEDSKLFINK